MKKLFVFVFVVLSSLSLVACSKEKEFVFENGVITIGLEADYPPFNWVESSKNDYNFKLDGENNLFVAGYDVEVAKHLAKELGLELKIKMIPWDALVMSLKKGQIDLIIAGMSPTEERMKSIDFTTSYYDVNHVVVVKKDSKFSDITKLEDLNGAKGIGQMGTIYSTLVDYVSENYGSESLPSLNSTPDITRAIISGVADFTVVEKPVAQGMVNNNSNLKIIFDTDDNLFNVADEDRLISAGIRKIDVNLKEKVNKVFDSLTKEQKDAWMEFANSMLGN